MGVAHFVKILLEELIEHFLPDDFPIDRACFNWKSFGDIANLNDPRVIQQKAFKQLKGNSDADPVVIFDKMLPSATAKDRSLKRIDLLIKLQEANCTKCVGFTTRNHFLNLYLRKDIPMQDSNNFSKSVKAILAQQCQFFPQQTTKSTAFNDLNKFQIYTF